MNLLRRRFKIARWIAEDFAEVITKENRIRLEQWRAENPVHAKEYDEIRMYVMAEYERREKEKQSMKSEWRKFERVHFRKYVIGRKISRYAAILVMPLLVCGYFVASEWKSSEITITDRVEIVPGTGKAQLIMADGRCLDLEQKKDMELDLPGVKVIATGEKIIYQTMTGETSKSRKEEYNTLVVPRGGEYMLELADGTKVWLNSDSELRFPVAFIGDRRSVEVEGEAYFEVVKDEGKPFHVLANGVDIKVLGTNFNVMTYRGHTITTLVEGKVCLTYKDESVLMVPDRQAEVIPETGKILMREVEARNFTLWKDGVFYFGNAALETIAERLSRWYDVNIVFNDEALKKLRYSVETKRYNNIQDILTKIEKTQKVKFIIQGKSIYVHKWQETYDLLE